MNVATKKIPEISLISRKGFSWHVTACERDWGRERQDNQNNSNTHNDLTFKKQMREYTRWYNKAFFLLK